MNDIQQEIKLIESWIESLSQIQLYLKRESENIETNVSSLYKKPFGKLRNYFKLKEIDKKRKINYELKDTLSDILYEVERTIRHIKYEKKSYTTFNSILTKDSYLKITASEYQLMKLCQELRFFILPLKDFLKTDEMYRLLLKKLTLIPELHNILNEMKISVWYGRLEEVDQPSVLSPFEIKDISTYYDSFGDILEESLTYGYSYEMYFDLALRYYSLEKHKEKMIKQEVVKELEEDKMLEQNANDVIERNLENSEVLDLYEKDELLLYRDSLLQTMVNRKENFELDEQNILNLQKINTTLNQRMR